MNTQIRLGIFKTNSSSVHTLTLGSKSMLKERLRLPVSRIDGKRHIYPGEFGWGPEVYTDPETKASYIYTAAKKANDKRVLDMLRMVVERRVGAEVVFDCACDELYPYGFVDHQSAYEYKDVCYTEEDLENFIFNPDSKLVIDNDNY